MSTSRPRVVITRKLPAAIETRMAELFDVVANQDDHAFTRNELLAAVASADVLVPTITDRIDENIIAAAGPQLKLISNFGNGVDHIDIAAAKARGITVTNTPGVLTDDTADMVMALIMAVSRRIIEGAAALQSGRFTGWSPTWMLGSRLRGKSIGIIGMGRIGTAVARRAKAFGLDVYYHNRTPAHPKIVEELGAHYCEGLDTLLSRVDILSINCPHTPATNHLLSARRLKLLKPTAIVVNTARGGVVDEDALIGMLEAGDLAGAGLDVFEHEPAVNPKLLALRNVVLLPHMGSATLEGRMDMGDKVIINIKTWADGHKPPDRILLV